MTSKMAFSGIIHRKDCKYMIDNTNKKLKNYCAFVTIAFVNNANVDGSCLNRSRMHLNCKVSANLFSKNVDSCKTESGLILRVR